MKLQTILPEAAALIEPYDTPANLAAYRRRDPRIARIDRAIDLNMRYRWDLYWAAWHAEDKALQLLMEPWRNVAKDDHIDTMLRRIVPDIV